VLRHCSVDNCSSTWTVNWLPSCTDILTVYSFPPNVNVAYRAELSAISSCLKTTCINMWPRDGNRNLVCLLKFGSRLEFTGFTFGLILTTVHFHFGYISASSKSFTRSLVEYSTLFLKREIKLIKPKHCSDACSVHFKSGAETVFGFGSVWWVWLVTNYCIGPHRRASDHIRPHRTMSAHQRL